MNRKGFTLVELLTVMAVIAILAGLVLSTAGYVQKKAARSKAQSEIAALSAACEGYKADNGIYPRDTTTDSLIAGPSGASGNPTAYAAASLVLYRALSGDTDLNRQVNASDASKNISGGAATAPSPATPPKTYFEFPPGMLLPTGGSGTVTSVIDPFGNNYGYSTAYTKWQDGGGTGTPKGYNPTFDLWSTGGQTATSGTMQWIKNW